MAEAALAELHDAVVTGALPPGAPLRLEELAASLDMSISPIREAIRELESLGLAEHSPHRGARVTDLSVDALRDTYEARLALESLAVRRAAEVFDDQQAEIAQSRLDAYTEAWGDGESRDLRERHAAFHFALYEASGSVWLPRLILPVWYSSERYRFFSLGERGSTADLRGEHQLILDACIAHDPDQAERLLYSHLAKTANLVASKMGAVTLF
jgi:DNA-binding GntR family transcriptional regulator